MSEPVAIPVESLKEAVSESAPSAPRSEVSEVALDESTQNHLSYKATHKVPFIIDYFGVNEFYNTVPSITEMAKELHTILVGDDNEVTIGQTKDDLDFLVQELNLQENDAPVYKLKKALFLAKIKDRNAKIEKQKMKMLADLA